MLSDIETTTTPAGAAWHAFLRRHCAGGQRLYAVADSARSRELAWAGFERWDLDRWSLFDRPAPHMSEVAPYLIPVPFQPQYPYPDSGYLDLWASRLGNNGGLLLTTTAHERTLWQHLRDLFEVVDEQGREFFFRWYDPRILRVYLPTCTAEESREFFGPIEQFIVESETPGSAIVCRVTDAKLSIRELPFGSQHAE